MCAGSKIRCGDGGGGDLGVSAGTDLHEMRAVPYTPNSLSTHRTVWTHLILKFF